MTLNHIIVHELLKRETELTSSVDLSEHLIPVNTNAEELVKNLNERYIKLGITYAKFGDDPGNLFPNDYSTFHNTQSTTNFIEFSRKTMGYLKSRVENIAPAKGGYLLFADYEESNKYIGIFFIRNTKGMLFAKSGSDFIINDLQHIDLEKMAMACRINKDAYQTADIRYLSFIKRKNEPTSEYFIKWINADDRIDNKTDTLNLLKILADIPKPNDAAGVPYSKEGLLEASYNFIKTLPGNRINLKTLSSEFFDDENIIINYAEENNIKINSEFKPHSPSLKKFYSVKVKADDIEISFPATKFNDTIRLDQRSRNLVTIRSEALANKIREAMEINGE